MSIKLPPAILGPEMAVPILWAPGIFWFFLLENPHAHKIPPFRGGGGVLRRGGWKCQFYFYGRGDFKSFSGRRTLWDSSLLVALTLWDTPVLCTPPLPSPEISLSWPHCTHSTRRVIIRLRSPLCTSKSAS